MQNSVNSDIILCAVTVKCDDECLIQTKYRMIILLGEYYDDYYDIQ